MKNLLKLTASALVATGLLAGTAQADVFLNWDVDKVKFIDIDIAVVKFKSAYIDVLFQENLDGAAEAEAFGNQWNADNVVTYVGGVDVNGGPPPPQADNMLINKTAETTNSFNNNEGIVQANQDVGNMVNQGNNAAVAMTNGDSAPFAVSVDTDPDGFVAGSFTHSESYSEQVNVRNQSYHHEASPFDNGPPAGGVETLFNADPEFVLANAPADLNATITNSGSGNQGVVHFNQNAGNMNNQYNGLALALGDESVYALSDAGIAQVNAGNQVEDENTVKYDTIRGSYNTNSGIVGVNQSSGHMNNQSTVVSMSALTSVAGIGLSTPATVGGP